MKKFAPFKLCLAVLVAVCFVVCANSLCDDEDSSLDPAWIFENACLSDHFLPSVCERTPLVLENGPPSSLREPIIAYLEMREKSPPPSYCPLALA